MLLNKIDRASCHNSIHVLETQGRAKDEPVWGVTKLLLHASRDRAVLLGRHPAAFITYNGLIWQCIFRWLFYQLCFLRKFHSSVAEECSNHFWPRDCALADFEVETLLGHEQSWVKGIGNTLETLNLHLQKAPPVDHASNPILSDSPGTIDNKSVWFYGIGMKSHQESGTIIVKTHQKSFEFSKSTGFDPNLSRLAIASSMRGLCQLFPSVTKKMWSWPPTTCYLLHLHHHNNFLLATRRCSSSHLALEWTACLQRQTSKLLHCINQWMTLTHITIASQILSDLLLNQVAFNSHLSRCFGVDGWKPCEDLRKDVRWPRVCARLQKAVGEERIIALQAPRRWPMFIQCWPRLKFGLFICFHVFMAPNMTRLIQTVFKKENP